MPHPARVAAACVVAVGALLLTRRMTLTWGTRDDEYLAPLPGDDLVPDARSIATRAITVAASARDVWPWLVQLGSGRAGFYSYDTVENLFGLDIHNADRIEPQWQALAVGDDVRLAPEAALRVARLEPEEHLVLHGIGGPDQPAMPFEFSWAFVLRPLPGGGTRLLVRERYQPVVWWAPAIIEPVHPVSFVMSARMLRGIRDRAEAAAGRRRVLGGAPERS